jgi:ADP-L-glycero-D-manno-heptose 6-epimerase
VDLLSPYATDKYALELYANTAFKLYQLPSIGLRFFNVYGPREYFKGNTSSMVIQLGHQILNGNAPRLFKNSNRILRDFIYIDDVVQANIKACSPKKNGIYNVATGIPRNFQEIADILQQELNTNLGTEYISNPYNGYQMNTQADISSAKKYLNFDPVFSLEKGIQLYIPEILRLHGTDSS